MCIYIYIVVREISCHKYPLTMYFYLRYIMFPWVEMPPYYTLFISSNVTWQCRRLFVDVWCWQGWLTWSICSSYGQIAELTWNTSTVAFSPQPWRSLVLSKVHTRWCCPSSQYKSLTAEISWWFLCFPTKKWYRQLMAEISGGWLHLSDPVNCRTL